MKILSFFLSKGNKDDRDKRIVEDLTKHVFGKLFGDKGYLSSSLFDRLFQNGFHLITKVKKNMKNNLMEEKDKILLRKRAIIETVNVEPKIYMPTRTRQTSIDQWFSTEYHFNFSRI